MPVQRDSLTRSSGKSSSPNPGVVHNQYEPARRVGLVPVIGLRLYAFLACALQTSRGGCEALRSPVPLHGRADDAPPACC
jgi:hypothetical protein